MKFVFPLTKEDGSEFKDQNELETLLQHEKIGQFGFNPNNSSWHGGIHFTDKNAPWLKSERPIRAIADGKVIACRVGKEYQTSEFMGEQLQFSNDFCLLQHSVPNPDDSDATFTFYSLYMHLAPLCAPHREVSANARYELTKNRNIRLEAGLNDNEVVLRASSVIEATNDTAVTRDGYIFKTFTIINNQNNTDAIAAEGNTVWLATHKEKQPVDITDSFLTNSSYTTYDSENSDFDMAVNPCVQTTQRRRARASSDMSKAAHTLAVESKLLRLENIEPVRSEKYLMAAYQIIDNKGERSTNVDLSVGSTIWLAVSKYPEPTDLFSTFTKTYAIPSWLYTEVEGRVNVDKLSGRSDPTSRNGELNAGEKICTIPKGTRVKYSKVKDSSMQFIGSTERHMARCSFPDNDVKDDDGQPIRAAWVCIEDNLVEVIRPKTVALSSDGAHKVNNFGNSSKLTVKAGDPIGYLGRFDAAQLGQQSSYKSRYQVHFEVFSTEQPPQFFIDIFFGQSSNTELSPTDTTQTNSDDTAEFKIVEDSFESDGFLDKDEPSEFFKLLFKKLTLGEEDVPGSDIIENLTEWDSCKHAITKHASEWAIKSGEKPFLDKLTEKYSNNDFKQLIEHEKSRIDNLIWMPNTQTLSNTKQVWNWWPINNETKNNYPLIWMKKVIDIYGLEVAKSFRQKVIEVGENLSIDPNYILACIALETGQTFDPAVKNPRSSATGLIQFMDRTARWLGTTTSDLAKMSHSQQLDYVELYFVKIARMVKVPTEEWTLEDVYFAIFTPAIIKKDLNDVIYKKGQRAYEDNLFHDVDKDGRITKKEIASNIRAYYENGKKYEN
ncbi:calcium-binding protein [Vibrio sp. TBV020]|uniref:calcium-binding protein n=1 Tax=Vibrio sp. TBV020 TaxID=3137398 RepID=UPI0038CD51FE